jgi:glycosyltransferase involved in cell wall biosynthesis
LRKHLIIIKASDSFDTRTNKFVHVFKKYGYSLEFVGIKRHKKLEENKNYQNIKYLFNINQGLPNKPKMILIYLFWIVYLFFHLFINGKYYSKHPILVINFDSAISVYFYSLFFKCTYYYDIHDELALSHNFPKNIKKYLKIIDYKIRKRAKVVIHVDKNRISEIDSNNFIILENSPLDYFNNTYIKPNLKHCFAVTGYLTRQRGVREILKFAKINSHIEFILAGFIQDEELLKSYRILNNLKYLGFIPQNELFTKIKNCCGIFSLYEPTIEINKLAASNKLYDALMLGIPVITNYGVENSEIVHKYNVGIVINYTYDNSWEILSKPDFIQIAEKIGQNGRKLYLEGYKFDDMVKQRFLPILENYKTAK